MLKVCSCCVKSRPQSAYSPENWASAKIRRCLACAVSNVPIQNPNIEGTLPLPSAQDGMRVFASSDIANDIVPDREGNMHLVLGHGKDPRNTCGACGKEGSEECKLQVCSRCKGIKYCSKQCQTGDWKRHKREECIKRGDQSKVQHLGKFVADEEKTDVARDKVAKGMEKIAEDKGKHQLPSFDRFRVNPDELNGEQKVVQKFTLRFYLQLSSFAAYHIERYRPLKGALLVFSRVSFWDLTDVPGNIEEFIGSPLDRMYAITWGCLPVEGVSNRPKFSALDLAEKFLRNATTLECRIEECCNRDSFPLVLCCDPTGELIPDFLKPHLRLPKNVDPVCYMDETPSHTTVTAVRFFDYDAMLEYAGQSADVEVKLTNIDRHRDDDIY